MKYLRDNPNIAVMLILLSYNLLGITVLGFNRTPLQVFMTVAGCGLFQIFLDYIFKRTVSFPTSAIVTGLGLSILLNYGHNYWLVVVPIFFGIMMKYVFTFKGKHIFNPGLMGVTLSFLITRDLISPAPAYQWNGLGMMSLFIAGPALFVFMPKINRHWLVGSFLATFVVQLIARSIIMKHYLPFNTLFFGTITSPAFFLFTFFMLTDPATTPNNKKDQIKTGIIVGLLDLIYHLFSSYHTFFYAALTLGTYKLIKLHTLEAIRSKNIFGYLQSAFWNSKYYKKLSLACVLAFAGVTFYNNFIFNNFASHDYGFTFNKIPSTQSQINFTLTNQTLMRTDSRVHNVAKWILSISDGLAVGDIDNDGLQDLFFTNGLKTDEDRNVFYKNLGDFKFQKISFPAISKISKNIEKYGLPANAIFSDYDNDGDLDLFISYAFGEEGTSRLFKNKLSETGNLDFEDITNEVGLNRFTNAASINLLDINKDGRLDLVIGNTIDTHLRDYTPVKKFNIFSLPQPEYEGDRRMFHFMHESWHMANNGGVNDFYIQNKDGKFELLDNNKINAPETRWTMAIGTADFNGDGYVDLYMANDFGPDDLYLSIKGEKFLNLKGKIFGSIGRDTYKGMNATIGDFDRNGVQDVYISNVHHPLQAEGSLMWSFAKGDDDFIPSIEEQATNWGVLNEHRFGWGANAADLNLDGWPDLVQANGMVDDTVDRAHDKCPDYWYFNEKIARSPPSIHTYSDNWADIQGRCIYGDEKNRIYVNRGDNIKPKFVDIADQVGVTEKGNFRGASTVDLNNDGRLDLVITSHYSQPLILENIAKSQAQKSVHWLGIELVNTELKNCNRSAIGSQLKINYTDELGKEVNQFVETTVANGFSSQSDRRVVFGLNHAKKFNYLEVNWCLQEVKVYKDLKLDQYHLLKFSQDSKTALK